MLRPHEVVWCASGPDALALLSTDIAFDLMLCDVMMHPMSGWEVLERVRAEHPDLVSRFAFVTGGAFTRTAQAELDRAGVPVVFKPVETSDVLSLLEVVEAE